MTWINKKTFRGLLAVICATSLYALPVMAENDFGMDFSAEGQKRLMYNRMSVKLGLNARTQDNSRQMDRWNIEVGASYKVVNTKKFDLKVGLSYEQMWLKKLSSQSDKYKSKYKFDYVSYGTFQAIKNGYNTGYNYDAMYWRNRSRVSLSVAAAIKPIRHFELSLRETLQYNRYYGATTDRTKYREKWRYDETAGDTIMTEATTTYLEDSKEAKNRWMLRSKLTLQYGHKRTPWGPYISVDYGQGLGYNAHKWKFSAGTDYKLSKQHTLNVFYRFQTENDDDDPNGHIVGVGYNFKF